MNATQTISRPAMGPASYQEIYDGLAAYYHRWLDRNDLQFEVRMVKNPKGASGHFFNLDTDGLVKAAKFILKENSNPESKGLYCTINPTPRNIKIKGLTKDDDILGGSCYWVLLDIDPERPQGFYDWNATDEETQAALAAGKEILKIFPLRPNTTAFSGNGFQACFPVAGLSSADHNLILNWLNEKAQSMPAISGRVKIDSSVSNPARIWRIPGTHGRKPGNGIDRPNITKAAIISQRTPAEMEKLISDNQTQLEALLIKIKAETKKRAPKIVSIERSNVETTLGPAEKRPSQLIRAMAYADKLAQAKPAISGQGGHNATFANLCKLFQKFTQLTESERWQIACRMNETGCIPPWSDQELLHKVKDAIKAPAYHAPLDEYSPPPPAMPPQDLRPALKITVDESTVTKAALEILKDDLFLYNKAGRLVSPMILQKKSRAKYKNKQQGRLSLVGIEPTFIRARLMERARLYRETFTKKGEIIEEPTRCPEWLPNAIAATAINAELNPIRTIEGILAGPVIDEEGNLQNNEGYCLIDDNGWYQAGRVEGLQLHDDLSQNSCKAMAKRLLDILCDFEFEDPTLGPVKWLSCLLSQVSRQLYQNCPLFIFSANVGGAGKTHLAKAIGIICHGAECIAPEWPAAPEKREDEFGKANAGFAFSGTTLINYDNAPDGMILSSPVLENQLTAAYIEHRENHKHTSIGGRNWIQFSATGNNIRPTVFLARRSIGISLQSTSANPSRIDPSAFTYGDFLSHIKKNRTELLKDALSLMAGYIRAGKPPQNGKHLACFEGWLQIPCSAVRWATGADPLNDHQKLMADSDPTTQALEMLALGWIEAFPEGAVRSSRIFNLVTSGNQDPITENIKEAITIIVRTPLKNVNQIGPALQKFKGRIIEVNGEKYQLSITIDPHTKRSLFSLFKI